VSFVVFVTLAVVSVAGAEQRVSTRAAFLKVGNAICSRATQQMDLIGITFFESPGHSTRAERMAFARKVAIPTAQHELGQLRALRPPTGDELRVKAILAAFQAAVNKVRADPSSFGGRYRSERASQLARAYGLSACAN